MRARLLGEVQLGELAVSAIVAILVLMTGASKSVSICGVNGARMAASGAVGRRGRAEYIVGLGVGAALLCGTIAVAGNAAANWIGISVRDRALLLAILLALLGVTEFARGPRALPHIAWAVPQSWARRPHGMASFGFIRGLAIFNHSPFSSMHAFVLALVLLPDLLPVPLTAALMTIGLALWSVVYAFLRVAVPAQAVELFDRWTSFSLVGSPYLARIDGAMLFGLGAGAALIVR